MENDLCEFDMYFCDEDGNIICKIDNPKTHIEFPEEKGYKPIRMYEVNNELIEKVQIGDYINFEIVIKGVDLSIEGNIVEINGNVIGIQ